MTYTPKGGRGLKAEYPTTTIRVPVGLVRSVSTLVRIYRMCGTDVLSIAMSAIANAKKSQRPTRDWTKLNLLIDEIEAQLPANTLDDEF